MKSFFKICALSLALFLWMSLHQLKASTHFHFDDTKVILSHSHPNHHSHPLISLENQNERISFNEKLAHEAIHDEKKVRTDVRSKLHGRPVGSEPDTDPKRQHLASQSDSNSKHPERLSALTKFIAMKRKATEKKKKDDG